MLLGYEGMTMELSDFSAGDRVVLTQDTFHEWARGRTGTIKRILKDRNMVQIALTTGSVYNAHPRNVQILEVRSNADDTARTIAAALGQPEGHPGTARLAGDLAK